MLPREWRPVRLRGAAYFAKNSSSWGGGVAFFDPEGFDEVMGRTYRISAEQFSDIAAQEQGRDPGDELDLESVIRGGEVSLGPGWYDRVLYLGELLGSPMLTVTAPWAIGDEPKTVPSARYLATVARGLIETHGWTAAAAGEYLARLPGCREAWDPYEISALVTPVS